jgi:uncharacterized membrane protein
LTPSGLDGKTHAAGFAVCHQLESHSYSIGGKVLPLCARCTGTFWAYSFLWSLFFRATGVRISITWKNHPSGNLFSLLPSRWRPFNSDFFLWIHTTLSAFQSLRLVTGFLMGIAWQTWFLPLWQQTLW